MIAGGVESISGIRPGNNLPTDMDPWLVEHKPELFMAMIDTADVVAKRYNISREDQDAFSLLSQQRTATAQAAGLFDNEIIACATKMAEKNKETGEVTYRDVVATKDNCNRANTTLEGLAKLEPVKGPGNFITAGNASQLSDGSSACVVVEAKVAERLGLKPWAPSVALPSLVASLTKWASAPCLPCPSCWRATASRWMTSICGS